MPVSLAQAKLLTTDDVDLQVIDEFQKSSFLLDRMTFDDVVSGAGNGATLTYAYQRLITQPTAAFRAINAEYTPAEVTKQRYSVDLKPLGGSFQIDRVLNRMAAGAETALQMSQKIKAANAFFSDQVINGDTAVDANGFDGLSKSLTGSSTEYLPLSNGVTTGYIDLTTVDTKAEALAVMAHIDSWLALMDGTPDAIMGNRKTLALMKYVASWAEQLDRTTDAFGRPVTSYNGIPLIDLGTKAGANTDVIALAARDADAGGAGGNITGLGDLYAVRFGLDAFHGVSMAGAPLVQTWLPDFTKAGAVKTGEVELGPVAVVLKATKAAAVLRNLKSA
ncbi:major capsid protein [Streptosporangium canum]|uniref:major capsid protein n=1 Tax=Streptosporangium canum TaxID=324952 RepID=UPI00342D6CE6